MRHGRLLFLHPVLRPGGFDYVKGHFGMTISESMRDAGGTVRVRATLDLDSATLGRLVEERRAAFLVMMQCARTYYRQARTSGKPEIALEIPAGRLAGSLRLTPYVVASEDLGRLATDEHVDEIRDGRGAGRIPRGSVLAVGAPHEVETEEIGTVKSAIKIQRNERVREGRYAVNTVGDFVVIELGPRTYASVARIRGRLREALYPSIYQAAVEHAVRKMRDEPDRKWARALQKTLEDRGLTDRDIDESPNRCAQAALDDPLGRMIRRLERGAPDDC